MCWVITKLYKKLELWGLLAWGPFRQVFFLFFCLFFVCLFCLFCLFVFLSFFLSFCLFCHFCLFSLFSLFSLFLLSFLSFCLFVFLSFCHHYHNHRVNIYYHTHFCSNLTIFQFYHTFHYKPLPLLPPTPPQWFLYLRETQVNVLRGLQRF